MKKGGEWANRMRQQAFPTAPYEIGDTIIVRHISGHHQEEATFWGFSSNKNLAGMRFGIAGCRWVHMKNTKSCPSQRGTFKEATMRYFRIDDHTLERLDATPATKLGKEEE